MKIEAMRRLYSYHKVQHKDALIKDIKNTEDFIAEKKKTLTEDISPALKKKAEVIINMLEEQLADLKQEIEEHDYQD
jgi:predicted ATP-binding protein involved in virulence